MVRLVLGPAVTGVLIVIGAHIMEAHKHKFGEVRLRNEDNAKERGLLVVYYTDRSTGNSDWRAVCFDNSDSEVHFNEGAAAAACRQKNYVQHYTFDSAKKLGFTQVDIPKKALTGFSCPYTSNYTEYGELNLLRCHHLDSLMKSSNCSKFVGIVCVGTELTLEPYPGQVRLRSGNIPVVEMSYENNWRPLCLSNFTTTDAGTVCRQLGFTESSYIGPYPTDSKTVPGPYLSMTGLDCKSTVSCLTKCFKSIQLIKTCGNFYTVTCVFNHSNIGVYGSGSKSDCSIPNNCPVSLTVGQDAGAGVVLFLFGFIAGVLILAITRCTCLRIQRCFPGLRRVWIIMHHILCMCMDVRPRDQIGG